MLEGRAMSLRLIIVVFALLVGLATSVRAVLAQTAGTGTLVGRVVLCKFLPRPVGMADRDAGLVGMTDRDAGPVGLADRNAGPVGLPDAGPEPVGVGDAAPGPVGLADGDPGPLADVTPGGNRRVSPLIKLPVANAAVSIQGTGLTARTDAAGAFTLAGVPASQPLTVLAQFASGPPLVLAMPNLTVGPGQTLDLGALSPAACGDATSVLVQPAPADVSVPPAANATLGAPEVTQPLQAEETTDDAGPVSDGSE
jgi:hypothetical protein